MSNPSLKDKIKFRKELASIDRERARAKKLSDVEKILEENDPHHLSRSIGQLLGVYAIIAAGIFCMFFPQLRIFGFVILGGFVLYAGLRNFKH